jgi:hypothetical protein
VHVVPSKPDTTPSSHSVVEPCTEARTRAPGAIEKAAVVITKLCGTPSAIVAVLLLVVARTERGAKGAVVTTTSVGKRGSIVILLTVTASSLPKLRPEYCRA